MHDKHLTKSQIWPQWNNVICKEKHSYNHTLKTIVVEVEFHDIFFISDKQMNMIGVHKVVLKA